MELREFAEIILYGKNLLEDKLLHPTILTDDKPGEKISSPIYPGRPKELDFSQTKLINKVQFPNQNELEEEKQRGLVLHFFANHELLAMELMALALLKFPNAPKNFRMGIARTILEEQKHMTLYTERMNDFNVTFGEIPVNDFFWKCLSDMATPMDYVTKLSMTFEQANLDFSYYYMKIMEKIGDKKTADILKTVYEEEIGHVKHGVTWFDRWRELNSTQWECYVKQMKLPLSPARAKGQIFIRNAREQTGLNSNYIDELFVYSSSKGRPPDVYFFNPACELEIEHDKIGFQATKPIQQLQSDCANLFAFVANQDDIVLTPKKPSIEFLSTLKECGFNLPEWREYSEKKIDLASFKQNILGSLKPWGWSYESLEFFKELIPQCVKKPNIVLDHKINFKTKLEQNSSTEKVANQLKRFYSKTFSAQLTHEIHEHFKEYHDILTLNKDLPKVVSSLEEVRTEIEIILQSHTKAVIKNPFGTAGQNIKRIDNTTILPNDINWIQNKLKLNKNLIIEPWFEKELDFSTQLKVENKKIVYLGETRCLNDSRGQYIGTLLGKRGDYFSQNQIQFIYKKFGSENLNFLSLFKKISLFIGQKLLDENFDGPFGIDAFIYKDSSSAEGYRIKFISEINPRFTMGRIGLELSKRIVPQSTALWIHLRVQDILKRYPTMENFVETIKTTFPIMLVNNSKPQITKGVLFTNDLLQAQQTATVLVVGKNTIEEFLSLLNFEQTKLLKF